MIASPRLTVQLSALGYAAELRLPPDTSAEHRQRVVDQILEELELTAHRSTRIGKLTPEFRRLCAMAIELISRPTLLVVDEPGAGLDADQESHVLKVLRRQADIGCVVVASMTSPTSLTHLDMCDQVLVLTPRGPWPSTGRPCKSGPRWPPATGRRCSRRLTPTPRARTARFGPASTLRARRAASGRRTVATSRPTQADATDQAGGPSPGAPVLRRPPLPSLPAGPAVCLGGPDAAHSGRIGPEPARREQPQPP